VKRRSGAQKEAAEKFCWKESDDFDQTAKLLGGFFLLRHPCFDAMTVSIPGEHAFERDLQGATERNRQEICVFGGWSVFNDRDHIPT
jgi:hypothetical protein